MNGRACANTSRKAGSRRSTSRVKGSEPPKEEATKQCRKCKKILPLKDMKKLSYKKYVQGEWKKYARYYCSECFYDLFAKCDGCGKVVKKEETTFIEETDETLCDECFNESYDICDSCQEYTSHEDSIFSDDRYFCPVCAARLLFRCAGCDDYFQKDEGTRVGGLLYCEDCAGNLSSKDIDRIEAMQKFSDCDVDRAYPGLKERIAEVYERSAWNRSVSARKYASELKKMLPDVVIDFESLTYMNEIGVSKSLTDIMSPRNSLNKKIALSGDVSRAVGYINALQNNKGDINNLFNERDNSVQDVYESLKLRMLNEEKNPDLKHVTDVLEGEFKHLEASSGEAVEYKFLVTKDPVAILAKSTSQCWENMSCEKVIRGEFGRGAFSDISLSNLVCYVLLGKLPVARIMVRWCKTEKDEIDFGIEKKWYYCVVPPNEAETFNEMGTSTPTDTTTRFIGGLSAYKATSLLVKHLQEKGFFKDYNFCVTPYSYQGYSDTEHSGRTSIRYRRNVE